MANFGGKSSRNVFLCHNSEDKGIVRRLGELLNDNGINPWVDECELGAGCDWQKDLYDALVSAHSVIVCLGPQDLGRWQKYEIKTVVKRRVEADLTVIPLILPTCGETDPKIPEWLDTAQTIDLRRDEVDTDQFGRLLAGIDSRDEAGHYRPSVLILRNEMDETSKEACNCLISKCGNVLHRVRVFPYSLPLLEERLQRALKHADVLVSLLAPDSYDRAGGAFQDGIAAGAKRLAIKAGVEVIQWRSDQMELPGDRDAARRFCTTDTETYLTANLAGDAIQKASTRFKAIPVVNVPEEDRKTTVLGFPRNGRLFARKIAGFLKVKEIRCDSLGEWELIAQRLTSGPIKYTALIVILNGDDSWFDRSTVGLDELESDFSPYLPPLGAYCHRAENADEADPIPFDLDQFEEYFGEKDLPKLAARIRAYGGGK